MTPTNYEEIISPKRSIMFLNVRALWRYKDLILLFVHRDFVAQYKQTILGPLWFIIQPVLTALMFYVVFSRIATIPTNGVHPFLFTSRDWPFGTIFRNV